MYEVLDDMAAQVILAIKSGDSSRRFAQHLHRPYETVRQAVNRLEDGRPTSTMTTASLLSTSA